MLIFFLIFALALALPVAWPGIDLWASGLFYRADTGFYLADNLAFIAVHWLAVDGSRALAVVLAAMVILRSVVEYRARRRSIPAMLPLNAKAWLFLLMALAIGPGLVANAGFKDHWGRARPHQIVAFGGSEKFSPALVPQPEAKRNGSFVCGDGAFGFFLPAFAFAAPTRRARKVFWLGMGAGAAFSFDRLAMGAHFLSDIVYGAALMLGVVSALHAAIYGKRETAARWRSFFTPANG